jgi:hypothetical protein
MFIRILERIFFEAWRIAANIAKQPAMANRANLVGLLLGRGYSTQHVLDRLGCSRQMVSQLMREAGEPTAPIAGPLSGWPRKTLPAMAASRFRGFARAMPNPTKSPRHLPPPWPQKRRYVPTLPK